MIVRYNGKNILSIGNPIMGEKSLFRFIPGVNIVPKDVWEVAKNHPNIKSKITKGMLQVLQSKDGTEVTKGEPPVKMISEMFDVLKLEELTNSKNKKVADAATARLLEINQPEVDADNEKEDE